MVSASDVDPAPDDREGVLGCGLGVVELSIILAVSVLLFLFWNGPLWSAPTGTSHVWRIALSYLVALPLTAGALALGKRLTFMHFISSVAVLWSVKLLLTSSLYAYLASGSASQYSPAEPGQQARAGSLPAPAEKSYAAAAAPSGLADVGGVVRDRGAPLAGAVVMIDAPSPGLPLAAPVELPIGIAHERYLEPLYLATTRDRVVVKNGDAVLHTLRLSHEGRTTRNLPLPPGTAPAIGELAAGVYRLSCENHASERGTLVIVDHPYATRSDAGGGFRLIDVPAGARRVVIVRPDGAVARRDLSPSIDFSEGE